MLHSDSAGQFARASLAAVAAVAFLTSVACAETRQDAHRAFYSISAGRLTGAATIVGASGAMTSEWERGCDGWTATQKLVVSMERREGPAVVSEVSASVFEAHEGTLLRFTSRTTIDNEVIEQVRGHAQRPSSDAPGRAEYTEPAGLIVKLPAGTLFPFQHTLSMIDTAKTGARLNFSPFFDGSQPDDSPLDVNTMILGDAHPADEGPGSRLGPLMAHRWWPVRLAFFPHDDTSSEPVIEMTQYVQENGVVRQFVFDYGDLVKVATLERIEPIDAPVCR